MKTKIQVDMKKQTIEYINRESLDETDWRKSLSRSGKWSQNPVLGIVTFGGHTEEGQQRKQQELIVRWRSQRTWCVRN